mmetsp:Transcript_6860/g.14891  ORF Transcript_6860/g.14891 Transcript_6860/m.14891 type:complete len:203 (+) Transcript_6860:29-637(+)
MLLLPPEESSRTNMASLFGVVVPGRPLITEFQALDSTKAATLLENPGGVTEITFFLLPTTPVPPGFGAILYYSVPPFQNWTILGSVYPAKPSGIFRTKWSTDEEVRGCSVVQLGVSLEPLETINNLELASAGVDDRFAFAHKIALDLWHYMASFSSSGSSGGSGSGNGGGSGSMVVPANVFDRWMERFERRYRQDPNFMMKG